MSEIYKTPLEQASKMIKGDKPVLGKRVKVTYKPEKKEIKVVEPQTMPVKNFNRQKYQDIMDVISTYRSENVPMEDIVGSLLEEYGPDHEELINYAASKWAE